MKKRTVLSLLAVFVLGVVAGVAASSAGKVTSEMYTGKSPKDAAQALLPVALEQAGGGSWENIGVGRVYYLMGDKAAGQAIFDKVIAKKMKKDDWMRLGHVYIEAKDWAKAKDCFDKALALDPKDESNLVEVGAWYNLHGDRATAEDLFGKAFARKADEVWLTVNAVGSYVGVKPQ